MADRVLLAGSARSGTTWVAKILEATGEFRFLFEPFHPTKNKPVLRHGRDQWVIGPEEESPSSETYFRVVSEGKITTRWMESRQNRERIGPRILIKSVRVQLALEWLHHRFRPAIVLLIRHPGGVLNSVLQLPTRDFVFELQDLLQRSYVKRYLRPKHREALKPARARWEKALGQWFVCNYISLRAAKEHGWPVFLYEEFCAEPYKQAALLLEKLGLENTPQVKQFIYESTSVDAGSPWFWVKKPKLHVGAWMDNLTEEQNDRIRALAGAFDMTDTLARMEEIACLTPS